MKKINEKITDLRRGIEKIESKFEAMGIIYSPDMVIKELSAINGPVTKKDVSSTELFSFIDKYITDHEFTRVSGSLTVYRSLKTHLEGYEKKIGKAVTFDKIDYAFFQGFQNFLVGRTKKDKNGKVREKAILEKIGRLSVFNSSLAPLNKR